MAFKPPTASLGQLQGIPFDTATVSDVEKTTKDRFDAFDTPGNRDKNMCKGLFHFPDGTVFWSSKMGVDADGPAAPDDPRRRTGKQLDPGSGQDGTSFHLPGRQGDLPSEVVPYLVLPMNSGGSGPFHPNLQLGDLAVVIYKGVKAFALCGDIGPFKKVGEGSIRLHELLRPAAPDPCKNHRDPATGFCRQIFDSSIEEDVLFFVFPKSAFGADLKLSDLTGTDNRLQESAFALYDRLRGSAPAPSATDAKSPKKKTKAAKSKADGGAHASATHEDAHGSSNANTKPPIEKFIESPHQSSRNGTRIDMVVLHCTEGTLEVTIETFLDQSSGSRQVSAHYVIDRDGKIYQMVRDSERANHCKGANINSIGIEHVGLPTDTLAKAQSDSSAALIRWLLEQYNIPRTRVFGHDFAPGYSGGGTTCPDKLFGGHTQQAVADWVKANV
ncbi:MAG TPA: N-acetylmuramoyl-L-alanine amidase [Chthoniobacterales bacterium]|nr:N-acetylmuramoyl-L-alanine amidase [Chthoniobacterales bacterium]